MSAMLTIVALGACFLHVSAESVVISAQVGSSSGGGGGGGGGGGSESSGPRSSVVFSGRAYPLSRVTILQDNRIAITTIAGPDAKFSVTLTTVSAGSHIFGVYSQDSRGTQSETFSFPIVISSGATTEISGIFIAPTIDVDHSEIKQGDTITIFGQSAPQSSVVISIHSNQEVFKTIPTDKSGAYLLQYDTSPLELGTHVTKSKASADNQVSSYSKEVAFVVGDKNVGKQACAPWDFNCDKKVNIVDFSIMAFWYKKPNPDPKVDLNHDKQVNLVDFSILAYHWTG